MITCLKEIEGTSKVRFLRGEGEGVGEVQLWRGGWCWSRGKLQVVCEHIRIVEHGWPVNESRQHCHL